MKKIGVIGAGNMGGGIAQKTAQEGLSVVLVDVKPEFVERGINNIRGTLQQGDDALSIGLVDHVLAPDQIDDKILALIKEGKPALRKAKKTKELPQDWRKLKELFSDANIDAWLAGEYIESDDPLVAKTAKMVASKAPIALRLSNQIIDQGYEKLWKEGLKEELAHLYEIFSTRDALNGLTSVGRERPKFEGK
jgi:enoyl-CoA hydratase/carnithine racemase